MLRGARIHNLKGIDVRDSAGHAGQHYRCYGVGQVYAGSRCALHARWRTRWGLTRAATRLDFSRELRARTG